MQAAAFLVPWCCHAAYRHILSSLEAAAAKFGLQYQLESGSCLGAVKLNNFIPWDIDIDIGFLTSQFPLWQPDGSAAQTLAAAGLRLHSYSQVRRPIDIYLPTLFCPQDNYSDRGAGSFMIEYGGLAVEMMGRPRLSHAVLPPHLQHTQTRIGQSIIQTNSVPTIDIECLILYL